MANFNFSIPAIHLASSGCCCQLLTHLTDHCYANLQAPAELAAPTAAAFGSRAE